MLSICSDGLFALNTPSGSKKNTVHNLPTSGPKEATVKYLLSLSERNNQKDTQVHGVRQGRAMLSSMDRLALQLFKILRSLLANK
jgi:hypothetical protein